MFTIQLLNLELWIIIIINSVLWLFIIAVPPVVIYVHHLKLFSIAPFGMAFLNIIILKKIYDTEKAEQILRHELAHVRQQKIFSPVGVSLIMLFHYGYLLIRYRSLGELYRHSWFERNANKRMSSTTPVPKLIKFDMT